MMIGLMAGAVACAAGYWMFTRYPAEPVRLLTAAESNAIAAVNLRAYQQRHHAVND